MKIVLIAAIAENGVIGKDGNLPWKLKDDLRLFSNLTKNHTVIMGRKNYESIGKPLPNRFNIILSRNKDYKTEGCIVVDNLEEAIKLSKGNVFIIGGSEIYRIGMKKTTHFFRTTVHSKVDGNVYFPTYNEEYWESCYSAEYGKNSDNDYDFTFEILTRK